MEWNGPTILQYTSPQSQPVRRYHQLNSFCQGTLNYCGITGKMSSFWMMKYQLLGHHDNALLVAPELICFWIEGIVGIRLTCSYPSNDVHQTKMEICKAFLPRCQLEDLIPN